MLLGLPEIVVGLHGKPTFRRTSKRPGKAKRHFRADTASTRKNAIQGRSSHTELPGQFAAAQIVGIQIDLDSELAGKLDVATSTLNRILTGTSRISPEMALRLSKAL